MTINLEKLRFHNKEVYNSMQWDSETRNLKMKFVLKPNEDDYVEIHRLYSNTDIVIDFSTTTIYGELLEFSSICKKIYEEVENQIKNCTLININNPPT